MEKREKLRNKKMKTKRKISKQSKYKTRKPKTIRKYKMERIYGGNTVKQSLSPTEKEQIILLLGKKLLNKEITEQEFENAIKQINLSGFSLKDSVVSLLSPIQSAVKVVGDLFVTPIDETNINPRRTIIKILRLPKSSHNFVKNKFGADKAKSISDEYMILILDSFDNQGDKLNSDIRGVDNLLANLINGCIGPGCKDGITKQTPVIEKVITFTDNQNKKHQLEEMKEYYETSYDN